MTINLQNRRAPGPAQSASVQPLQRSVAALVVLSLLSSSCTKAVGPVVTDPASKAYVAEFRMAAATVKPTVVPTVSLLQPERAKSLKPGKKIVLLPPDSCDPQAIRHGTGNVQDMASTRCGSLMSDLELELGKQGYRIISWQTLRTSGDVSERYKAASRLGAEIIIEINQFSEGEIQNNERAVTEIRYGEMSPLGAPITALPNILPDETRLRCRSVALGIQQNALPVSAYEAVLSAKAVDPSSGDALWYYSNSQFVGVSSTDEGSVMRHYPAPLGEPPAVDLEYAPGAKNGLQSSGQMIGGLGALGFGFGLLGVALAEDQGLKSAATAGMVIGGLALVTGIALGIAGNVKMSAYNRRMTSGQLLRPYIGPEQVLCNAAAEAVPAQPGVPAGAALQPMSQTDVLQTVTSRREDREDPRRAEAIHAITVDFARQLSQVGEVQQQPSAYAAPPVQQQAAPLPQNNPAPQQGYAQPAQYPQANQYPQAAQYPQANQPQPAQYPQQNAQPAPAAPARSPMYDRK